jgi:hypothetical protein
MLRRLLIVAVAVFLGFVVWKLRPRLSNALSSTPPPAGVVPVSVVRNSGSIPDVSSDRSHLADDLNAPAKDVRSDLRVVAEILEAFRSNFPHDGNPVGSNAEITRALTGRNKLQLALIPSDHPAINSAGELCDRWGTPFFFHAESGTRMGIRSAGPDHKMWTADDIVLEP